MGQLRNYLAALPDGVVDMVVLRKGIETNLVGEINGGKLGVLLVDAIDLPMIAQPLQQQRIDGEEVPTEIAHTQLLGGSTILSINNQAVSNWKQIRQELIDGGESVVLKVQNPTKGNPASVILLSVTSQKRASLSELGWSSTLSMQFFDPIFVVRSSGGNPIKALQMGFDETLDMLVMTYLTLDRLFRRSVGVEQLRGPIGIIHIGSKIADRGFSYLFFFLAIISVNLAVLNFLPLPIVDGGLFLYLIYEKFFRKPPSIAFQNAAAVLGLGLIATLFLVTFYNDIARLVG
jgi:regulator of sigma E protease